MQTITTSNYVYRFEPTMSAATRARASDKLLFETIDALGGQIKSEEDTLSNLDFSCVNPATGPVSVQAAEPGDVLVVRILDIELPDQGVIVAGKGMGVLGDELDVSATKILPIEDDFVRFGEIELPVSAMIGVIGVAPKEGCFPTGTAHRHGGNMDAKEIGEGATLYLPVFQPGGLLAIGDVHAVMGDGEVAVSACEVASKVTVEVDVIKRKVMSWPVVEREEGFYVIVSLPTIAEALKEATRQAVCLLTDAQGLSKVEATMLASLAVDIGISQLVDPNKTAKAFIPRDLLPSGIL